MTNMFGFAGLGTAIAALICIIICYFLPYWLTSDNGIVKSNTGLTRSCIEINGVENCNDPLDALSGSAEDKLRAVRAMVMLGLLCTLTAIIVTALMLFKMKKKPFGFASGGLLLGAGIFLMIGMAIFVDEFKTSDTDYGAGFALCIVGWIVAWIAGGLVLYAAITMVEEGAAVGVGGPEQS